MNDKRRTWEEVGEDEGSAVLYGRETWDLANDMRALPPNTPRTASKPY